MLIGKILSNRYELIEIIGQGGMAIVYKAKDQLLNRFVAVKVLRQEFINDEQFIKKFKRESQSAASLSHHNIVNIYDVGVNQDIHFIVMELINGKTLKKYIRDKEVLDWKKSVNIALQISSALEHAHRNHIIHRDIKPHNIIMTPDDIAKVADFGIARAITSSTITQVEDTMGSVHYLSPEQARGGFVNEKSDLYSLGIVLYEMVTGKVPFDGETSVTVALKHIQEDIIPPKEINELVPNSLNAIILKLLNKNPDERYTNATVLMQDLNKAFLEPNTIYTKEHFDDNAPTQVTPILPKEEKDEENQNDAIHYSSEEEEKQEPKKKKRWPLILALIGVFAIASIIGALVFSLSGLLRVGEVEVPNVENLSLDDAISIIRENNLEFEISERRHSSEVARDLIIQQKPEAGKMIKENQVISLIVSNGERQVTIPDVKNRYETEAINQLENSGLEVGEIKYEFNSEVESGRVISQSPRDNLEVNEGTRVDLYVSKGKETISIPTIIGEHFEEAKNILSSLGLTLGDVRYENSEEYDKDYVMNQNPKPNGEVEKNTRVDVTVSRGQITTKTIQVDLGQYEAGTSRGDNDDDEDDSPMQDTRVNVRVKLLDYQTDDTKIAYERTHSIAEGVLEIPLEGTGMQLYTVEINNEVFKEDFITF